MRRIIVNCHALFSILILLFIHFLFLWNSRKKTWYASFYCDSPVKASIQIYIAISYSSKRMCGKTIYSYRYFASRFPRGVLGFGSSSLFYPLVHSLQLNNGISVLYRRWNQYKVKVYNRVFCLFFVKMKER